jgi:FixJ family two-component response regulator
MEAATKFNWEIKMDFLGEQKVYRSSLMRRMGADSLAELVRMAEKIEIPAPKRTEPS